MDVYAASDPSVWRETVASLGPRASLSLAEHNRLVEACWWLGESDAYLRHGEELHDRYVDADHTIEAADMALRLAQVWGLRGDVSLARGWLSRAERLVTSLPRGPVHGRVAYLRALALIEFDQDLAGARAVLPEITELAQLHRDKTLTCFVAILQGMTSVLNGDVAGFASLDEAVGLIVAGHVDPMWAGDIYCSVIHLCEMVGDLGRMRAWTDSLAAWAGPLSETFVFAAVTRVHQLQLLRAEGAWDTVEQELGEWSGRLVGVNKWVAGAGYYELGEIHRLRDRVQDAEACFDRARQLGIEPQPGEALLLDADGRTTEAIDLLRVALAAAPPLARARLMPVMTTLLLTVGDRRGADRAAGELEGIAARYGTPGLGADAASARAAWLMAAGRAADALPLLARAARIYREQRHRHALAAVHESLALAHEATGSVAEAEAARGTARAIYQRLGAVADLARLAPRALPAGLTAREAEVLTQVAAGQTNRQVARALGISEKTVGRHLESIFVKAGVNSRTAAAAWAREHHAI